MYTTTNIFGLNPNYSDDNRNSINQRFLNETPEERTRRLNIRRARRELKKGAAAIAAAQGLHGAAAAARTRKLYKSMLIETKELRTA